MLSNLKKKKRRLATITELGRTLSGPIVDKRAHEICPISSLPTPADAMTKQKPKNLIQMISKILLHTLSETFLTLQLSRFRYAAYTLASSVSLSCSKQLQRRVIFIDVLGLFEATLDITLYHEDIFIGSILQRPPSTLQSFGASLVVLLLMLLGISKKIDVG